MISGDPIERRFGRGRSRRVGRCGDVARIENDVVGKRIGQGRVERVRGGLPTIDDGKGVNVIRIGVERKRRRGRGAEGGGGDERRNEVQKKKSTGDEVMGHF